MQSYTLGHLRDDVLRRDLVDSTARVHEAIAVHLAYIAEFDARRLYAPAGYACMHAYCVRELRLTTDSASKRIQAARAARSFPVLFPALAEGRLHLAAVCLLAPHLTNENVSELIERATHRSKSEIQEFLASRFGRAERAEFIRALAETPLNLLHAPGHVRTSTPEPLSQKQFLVQFTLNEDAHAKLRYAQALLSHAIPGGELAQVFERALDALIPLLEKRKFGARQRQKRDRAVEQSPSASNPTRYIPTHVKRAVWERDQEQCTFVSAEGTLCGARRFLEFDHVEPVARGGQSTVEGLRLRCRAHNQYEADRIFGAGFMAAKREVARLASEERAHSIPIGSETRAGAVREAEATVAADQTQDLLAGLRSLGCRGEEARRVAELTRDLKDAPLEERMRLALEFLGKRSIQARTVIRVCAT